MNYQDEKDREMGEAFRLLLDALHPTDFLNILSPNDKEASWYIDAGCATAEEPTFVEAADACRARLLA